MGQFHSFNDIVTKFIIIKKNYLWNFGPAQDTFQLMDATNKCRTVNPKKEILVLVLTI
jgi:hypothetical protein